MSRRCELTGKGVLTGNNVSHANNKTRRRFLPNLNEVTLASETLDVFCNMLGTTAANLAVTLGATGGIYIGGAIVPLLTLGIPGSPPAAMLLGALMLHNIAPGPMLAMEHPNFLLEVTAILFLAAVTMWLVGISLARHVVKVLTLGDSESG